MYGVAMLAAAILIQDAAIESARTLTSGQARSQCWLPIEVVVRAPAAFEGEIAVVAPPVTVTKAVRLAAGETRTVVVPALPLDVTRPISIELRVGGVVRASRRLGETVRVVREGERLVIKPPPGWRDMDPACFEIVDAVEGEVWTPRVRFGVVEPDSARLRDQDPWIATKRDAAIFFVVVYAFAGFVTLLAVQRRSARAWAAAAAVATLSLLFTAGFLALYPRGGVTVRAWGIVADSFEYRLHVTRGGQVTFAQLAKPVFDSWPRVPPRIEVRLDRGCTIVGADAAMTVERAPASVRTATSEASGPELRLFATHFPGERISRVEERDPPLTGVSADGLVEARLAQRLVIARP